MLYAAKLALVRYFGTRSRLGGLPFNQKEKVRVFISSLGHLEMIQSVCDFLGLGTNCIVEVDTINQSFFSFLCFIFFDKKNSHTT